MLNYTYETVKLDTQDQPCDTAYLGISRDIAETRAVLSCTRGYVHDYAVMRVETGERVAVVRAAILRTLAGAAGLL